MEVEIGDDQTRGPARRLGHPSWKKKKKNKENVSVDVLQTPYFVFLHLICISGSPSGSFSRMGHHCAYFVGSSSTPVWVLSCALLSRRIVRLFLDERILSRLSLILARRARPPRLAPQRPSLALTGLWGAGLPRQRIWAWPAVGPHFVFV